MEESSSGRTTAACIALARSEPALDHDKHRRTRTSQSPAARKTDDGRQLLCLELSAIFVLETGIRARSHRRHGASSNPESRIPNPESTWYLRSYPLLPEALPLL